VVKKVSVKRTKRGVAPLRFLSAIFVVAVCLHPTARATAESLAVAFQGQEPSGLSATRDPKDFVSDLAVALPRPTIVLNRQDAVARELLTYSSTLSVQDAIRTAQELCSSADALGYDPLLFLAVIHVESFYNHLAISPVGAEGLMQLMPPTAEWMAARLDLRWPDGHSFDPLLNVRLGTNYLVYLHKLFGRMDYALTAYNRGPNATRYLLSRFGQLPAEIHEFYSAKVLAQYERLRAQYGHLPLG
jgi:soluble lytic murein transglycosylase-like protein